MFLKNSGSDYTLSTISHIIDPRRQRWDKSEMRVYNHESNMSLPTSHKLLVVEAFSPLPLGGPLLPYTALFHLVRQTHLLVRQTHLFCEVFRSLPQFSLHPSGSFRFPDLICRALVLHLSTNHLVFISVLNSLCVGLLRECLSSFCPLIIGFQK
jgi:hypothetical protein